jgi:Iron-containing redox enzyme
MSTAVLPSQMHETLLRGSIKHQVDATIDGLIARLPDIDQLTSEERRGIIARYAAVLEGNFIYWMTATLLAVRSKEARPILIDNLHEEIRDSHPVMMRKFAIAAHALPTDRDALAVDEDLTKVRRFLGRLSGVQSLVTMAFFEGFIQRFMAYFAGLAIAQGSRDLEYTDVHGVCDIAHTDGLFQALAMEMEVNPPDSNTDLFEGVHLLRNLIQTIIHPQPGQRAA